MNLFIFETQYDVFFKTRELQAHGLVISAFASLANHVCINPPKKILPHKSTIYSHLREEENL